MAAGVDGIDTGFGTVLGTHNLAIQAAIGQMGVAAVDRRLAEQEMAAGQLAIPFGPVLPPPGGYRLGVTLVKMNRSRRFDQDREAGARVVHGMSELHLNVTNDGARTEHKTAARLEISETEIAIRSPRPLCCM